MKYKSGKTPLVRVEEFCRKFNLPNLLVKDESKNPFGTWKDRRSEAVVKKAKKEFVDKLCLITSGNAGFSLAEFANSSHIKVVSFVDINLPSSTKQVLKEVCTKVIETDLSQKIFTPEEIIALARENDKEVIWEVTNGFHEAYESIVKELKKEVPDYILCPVGSGEGFVGLFGGLKKAKLKTKLLGVMPASNPSFADKLHTPWTPYSAKMKSILKAGHELIKLSEGEVRSAFAFAKDFMDCEPSSAVVVGALSKLSLKESDKIVIVNSGKGRV
ncbi:MAG: PLP-dependent lyase/thiolase [Candidatus Brennerbacteria bacterium]|nr:PLP-dependent lyase/thiolase [Candidatus Brennerbacteria bacterium]